MIRIILQPEYIFTFLGISISNSFFTSMISSLILIVLGLIFYLNKDGHSFLVNGITVISEYIFKLVESVTEDRSFTKKVFPLVSTFFFVIAVSNLITLLPGFLGSLYIHTNSALVPILRAPNSDLTSTLALALISMFSIQVISIRKIGIIGFISRFINFSSPINFVMGIFEIIGELTKIISFSFRLFGNIFAGEVLFLVSNFFFPFLLPVPFLLLESFVGLVQAFIFAVLTLSFIEAASITKKLKTKN